jgi:hypothetical protein
MDSLRLTAAFLTPSILAVACAHSNRGSEAASVGPTVRWRALGSVVRDPRACAANPPHRNAGHPLPAGEADVE